MNFKRTLVRDVLGIACFFHLVGCSSPSSAQPANELHYDLSVISDVALSYDEESIVFFPSDNQELVIKEYMSVNQPRYYAKVKQDSSSIRVSEGGKPLFKGGFSRNIEIYLPKEYERNLTITTTDGKIDLSNMNLELSSLRIDSTAGAIHLNDVTASAVYLSTTSGALQLGTVTGEQIRLETTSGTVDCDKLNGNVTYNSTSGDLDVKSAFGSGTYRASNSGKLIVNYSEVTGDLTLFNKNDGIGLTLPKDLEFEFEATTKNGSVSTTFGENLSLDERTTIGIVGTNPTVSIKVETKNGNIRVVK